MCLKINQRFLFFLSIFLAFYGFIDGLAEEVTGDRLRERGGVTHSKGPPAGSRARVPRPLYMGRTLYQLMMKIF